MKRPCCRGGNICCGFVESELRFSKRNPFCLLNSFGFLLIISLRDPCPARTTLYYRTTCTLGIDQIFVLSKASVNHCQCFQRNRWKCLGPDTTSRFYDFFSPWDEPLRMCFEEVLKFQGIPKGLKHSQLPRPGAYIRIRTHEQQNVISISHHLEYNLWILSK